MRLLWISHSRRFGEGVTGRGRTARNRVQGNKRHDRCNKPERLRAEASGSAERWPSEVDYGVIYRGCEVVMNGRNIVTFWVTAMSSFCHAQYSQEDITETPFNAQTRCHPWRRRTPANEPHDFSFHTLGLAARVSILVLSRSTRQFRPFQLLQLHHFKF